jgi:Ca2+-binding RTX toxin-like protein
LAFSGSDQEIDINAGVTVGSTMSNGLFCGSLASNDVLSNSGLITSSFDVSAALEFDGANGKLTNQSGATISGEYTGVNDNGSATSLQNSGAIFGITEAGVVVGVDASDFQLSNRGLIDGRLSGVELTSQSSGGAIENSGTIESADIAINVGTHAGLTTTITNLHTGIIEGSTAILMVPNLGGLNLVNRGTINGTIFCDDSGASNTIVNSGHINGAVELFGAADFFDGRGGFSGTIELGVGNDRVIAGKGAVVIDTGTGNETLTGGPGHDQFNFDSGAMGMVKVTNFDLSRDTIGLSASSFTGIGVAGHHLAASEFHVGSHATAHAQHIIYNPDNGFLYYDADGSGPQAGIHFGTLSPHLALSHTDFLLT